MPAHLHTQCTVQTSLPVAYPTYSAVSLSFLVTNPFTIQSFSCFSWPTLFTVWVQSPLYSGVPFLFIINIPLHSAVPSSFLSPIPLYNGVPLPFLIPIPNFSAIPLLFLIPIPNFSALPRLFLSHIPLYNGVPLLFLIPIPLHSAIPSSFLIPTLHSALPLHFLIPIPIFSAVPLPPSYNRAICILRGRNCLRGHVGTIQYMFHGPSGMDGIPAWYSYWQQPARHVFNHSACEALYVADCKTSKLLVGSIVLLVKRWNCLWDTVSVCEAL